MTRPRMLDADAERFGAIVNLLRLQRGWSLAHLAKVTGMNAIHLGVLERGENVPSLATILRVADALGVAPGGARAPGGCGAPCRTRETSRTHSGHLRDSGDWRWWQHGMSFS